MRESAPVLPSWLEEPPRGDAPPVKGRRRRRGSLEKTLHGFAEALRSEVFSGEPACRPGLLQRVDPRVKVLTTAMLIGVAAAVHHPAVLVLLNLWLLWLARASRVPPGLFLKRVWIVVPLFTGVAVFPALFNVVRPGDPLFVLFHLSHSLHLGPWSIPAEVAVTRQGAASAALLVLRTGASVSLAVLFALTTPWPSLLKALGVLRIPRVFLAVLEMTYRYAFLLMGVSAEMFTARRSRMVGRSTSREQRRFVASVMGGLWGRSRAAGEEVHRAMLSRGFTGEPRTLARFRLRPSDGVWVALVLLLTVLLLGGDHALG
jgi:cobalt/nickel transport system permease protein